MKRNAFAPRAVWLVVVLGLLLCPGLAIAQGLPVVTLTASDASASEVGLDPGEFTFTRSGGDLTSSLTVSVTIGGTATNFNDYQGVSTSITFPANQATVTRAITPFADNLVEGSETVTLTLTPSTAYQIGASSAGTVTITDSPALVTLAATDANASEAGPNTGEFTFTRAGGDLATGLTVSFTIGGTATNFNDYQGFSTSITFPANQATVTRIITPFPDNLVEGDETITLMLTPSTTYQVGTTGAVAVTIADSPAVVTLAATDTNALELGPKAGEFTFTRSGGDLAVGLSVSFTIGGTATNFSDYQGFSTSITFPANQATVTRAISPFPDNLVEGSETVTLTLTPSTTYQFGASSGGTVTIADSPAVVALSANVANASEVGPKAGEFTFTRSGGDLAVGLSVSFTIGGTATNGTDYQFIGNSITFPANQSTVARAISTFADNLVEGAETVTLTINPSTTYQVGTTGAVTVTIADSPAVITLAATDPNASEVGPKAGEFTFTRSGGDLAVGLSISFTIGGTATNGSDYQFIGNSITFPANQSAVTRAISTFADNLVEGAETVTLTINPSTTYQVGTTGAVTVTIADSPAVITLAATDPNASEVGPKAGEFTFTRSGGDLAVGLSVSFTVGGTASNSSDYQFIGNSITFPANETTVTRPVSPFADSIVEPAETVTLTLNSSSTYLIGTPGAGTVTIADNPGSISVVAIDSTASEIGADPAVFRVSRSGSTGGAVTVAIAITGTATNGQDYSAIAGSVQIPDGATFVDVSVTPTTDGLVEGPESVTMTLVAGSGYALGQPTSATVVIEDAGPSVGAFSCYTTVFSKGNVCSPDARKNAGGSCAVEEDCGGSSGDEDTDETSFCVPNKFPKGLRVSLVDALETDPRIFDVKKPVDLCTPADSDEAGSADPDTHLEGLQIVLAKGQPKSVTHVNIPVTNQFHMAGALVIDAVKTDRLLVPSAMSLGGPVPPPAPGPVGHYACYTAKTSKGAPKFTPIPGVVVVDQFTGGDRVFDLTKPSRLCLPADKNGDGVPDDATPLMCYQARPTKGLCAANAPANAGGACSKEPDCGGIKGQTALCTLQPTFETVAGIYVGNQLAPGRLDLTTEEALCVPSTVGAALRVDSE